MGGRRTVGPAERRRGPGHIRGPAGAVLLAGMGVWAAVLTFHGAPVLGPITALFLFASSVASLLAVWITGAVVDDAALEERVVSILDDLCRRAACPVPRVQLRAEALWSATVQRIGRQETLVLSRRFVGSVDDAELAAVLAHEVSHLAHDDLALARREVGIGALIAGALASIVCTVIHPPLVEGLPVVWAVAMCGASIGDMGLCLLRRSIEQRADREGALLVGDPEALARALVRADETSRATARQWYGTPPWSWLRTPRPWRRALIHTPLARRIARLQAMDVTVPTAPSFVIVGVDTQPALQATLDAVPVLAPPDQPMRRSGWYADPKHPGRERYWDGTRWTKHTS